MEEARRIGVYADNVRMDWDVITRRLWHKINENSAIKDYYAAFPNVDVYEGTASFTGKKSLHIAMNDGTAQDISGDKISSASAPVPISPTCPAWKKRAT